MRPSCYTRYTVMKKRAGGGKSKGNGQQEKASGCMEDMQKLMLEEFSDARGRVQCGIVYCLSRADCEKVAAQLSRLRQKNGQLLKAHHYHANMDQVTRGPVGALNLQMAFADRVWAVLMLLAERPMKRRGGRVEGPRPSGGGILQLRVGFRRLFVFGSCLAAPVGRS